MFIDFLVKATGISMERETGSGINTTFSIGTKAFIENFFDNYNKQHEIKINYIFTKSPNNLVGDRIDLNQNQNQNPKLETIDGCIELVNEMSDNKNPSPSLLSDSLIAITKLSQARYEDKKVPPYTIPNELSRVYIKLMGSESETEIYKNMKEKLEYDYNDEKIDKKYYKNELKTLNKMFDKGIPGNIKMEYFIKKYGIEEINKMYNEEWKATDNYNKKMNELYGM